MERPAKLKDVCFAAPGRTAGRKMRTAASGYRPAGGRRIYETS